MHYICTLSTRTKLPQNLNSIPAYKLESLHHVKLSVFWREEDAYSNLKDGPLTKHVLTSHSATSCYFTCGISAVCLVAPIIPGDSINRKRHGRTARLMSENSFQLDNLYRFSDLYRYMGFYRWDNARFASVNEYRGAKDWSIDRVTLRP